MRSTRRRLLGSVMKQPRKFFRQISVTDDAPTSRPVHDWFHTCLSIRSRMNGTHPIPPSESATLRFGNLRNVPAVTRSVNATAES